jgi:hypothetical protein
MTGRIVWRESPKQSRAGDLDSKRAALAGRHLSWCAPAFFGKLLLGKYFLPWFGGTPAKWTTCMYCQHHFPLRPAARAAVL